MLSGASRSAAKGRFSWRDVAVFCKSRHAFRAASIWDFVNGVRVSWLLEGNVVCAEVWAGEPAEEVGVNGGFEEFGVAFRVTLEYMEGDPEGATDKVGGLGSLRWIEPGEDVFRGGCPVDWRNCW